MSSEKAFPKKGFRSKTAVTNCGYCSQKIKEENLENHCKAVHKKPKLVAGQRTLDLLFSRPGVATGGGSPHLLDPDPTPPAAKKAKLSEDDPVIEEAEPSEFGDHILIDNVTETIDDNVSQAFVQNISDKGELLAKNPDLLASKEMEVEQVEVDQMEEGAEQVDAAAAASDSCQIKY